MSKKCSIYDTYLQFVTHLGYICPICGPYMDHVKPKYACGLYEPIYAHIFCLRHMWNQKLPYAGHMQSRRWITLHLKKTHLQSLESLKSFPITTIVNNRNNHKKKHTNNHYNHQQSSKIFRKIETPSNLTMYIKYYRDLRPTPPLFRQNGHVVYILPFDDIFQYLNKGLRNANFC